MKAERPEQLWLKDGLLHLYGDRIVNINAKKETHALDGVTARLESGSELESRVTATRLVALGVFAFAAKKKSGGESWLTIEGPDFFWTLKVDRDKRAAAQKFAAAVNQQSRQP